MSLFSSLMGDVDDDPIFGSHMRSMRQMSNMMNSLFADPFGMMGQNALTDASHQRARHNELSLMPFGFPAMPTFDTDRLFANFESMAANGNCHSFTSRSVMSMTSGPDGRPQVYQETMSTRTAPGGVKETKKTVCDSRTGTKKMAIGHHIGDRAHILEREHNIHNGDQEEHQEFINLEEGSIEEAETFNREWETRTRRAVGAIGGPSYGSHGSHRRPEPRQLALPDPSTSRQTNYSRWTPSTRRNIRSLPRSYGPSYSRTESAGPPVSSTCTSSSSSSSSTSKKPSTSTSTNLGGSRKREHTPDVEEITAKRHVVSDSRV